MKHTTVVLLASLLSHAVFAQTRESPAAPDSIQADQRTYMLFQVEKPATMSPNSPVPEYPRGLERSGIGGEVWAQFVVTRAGTADMDTFKVLKSTNKLFTQAVRSVVPRMRYSPGMIGGKPVNQLVQQSFNFAVPR